MKLKNEQITKLSVRIFSQLKKEGLLIAKTPENKILESIQSVLLKDAQLEDEIEAQVKKVMERFKSQIQSGEIDYQKMHGMILKQLLKEKKFTV